MLTIRLINRFYNIFIKIDNSYRRHCGVHFSCENSSGVEVEKLAAEEQLAAFTGTWQSILYQVHCTQVLF